VPELSSFDNTLKHFMQPRNIRSGTLAVVFLGRLVLARGYSWSDDPDDTPDPTSLFRIASLSKAFTAATVMYLVQTGAVHLDQPVTSILDFQPPAGKTVDPRLGQITIRYLLNHLGGWDSTESFDPMFRDHKIAAELGVNLPISKQHIITYMAGQPLDFDPGTRYAYSNFGYLLLGRVIEAISGQSYEDYVKRTLLAPLGITRMQIGTSRPGAQLSDEVTYYTGFGQQPTVTSVFDASQKASWPYGGWNLANMDAHGGWTAHVVDLARFVTSFDTPTQHPVLTAASINALFAEPPTGMNSDGWYYGCGWVVRPIRGRSVNTWHTGSLDGTYALMVRRWDGIDWMVLFNQRADPSGLSYEVIDDALHSAADAVTNWPDHDLFANFR
jgi:CubicO group peptidase (beta-lactamase class C family)